MLTTIRSIQRASASVGDELKQEPAFCPGAINEENPVGELCEESEIGEFVAKEGFQCCHQARTKTIWNHILKKLYGPISYRQ